MIELLNRRSSIKGRIQRYDTMLEQIGIRRSELSGKLLNLKSGRSQEEKELSRLSAEKKQLEEKIAGGAGFHGGDPAPDRKAPDENGRKKTISWRSARAAYHPGILPAGISGKILQSATRATATASARLWNRRSRIRGSMESWQI